MIEWWGKISEYLRPMLQVLYKVKLGIKVHIHLRLTQSCFYKETYVLLKLNYRKLPWSNCSVTGFWSAYFCRCDDLNLPSDTVFWEAIVVFLLPLPLLFHWNFLAHLLLGTSAVCGYVDWALKKQLKIIVLKIWLNTSNYFTALIKKLLNNYAKVHILLFLSTNNYVTWNVEFI